MRIDGKRPPWNERAVRCVLEHLIPAMGSYAGHAIDKLVLVNIARHAHRAGCGIRVSKYAQGGPSRVLRPDRVGLAEAAP
jgi:hypothetical protein